MSTGASRTPLPRPASFDFSLEREAQESPDEHNDSQQTDTLKRQRRRDRADDVSTDEQFQSQQDAPAEICPVALIGIPPIRLAAFTDEPGCREDYTPENDKDPRHLQAAGDPFDIMMNLLHRCGNRRLVSRFRLAAFDPLRTLPERLDAGEDWESQYRNEHTSSAVIPQRPRGPRLPCRRKDQMLATLHLRYGRKLHFRRFAYETLVAVASVNAASHGAAGDAV